MNWDFWIGVAIAIYIVEAMVLCVNFAKTEEQNSIFKAKDVSIAEMALCPLFEDWFRGKLNIIVLLATLGWFLLLPLVFVVLLCAGILVGAFYLVKLLFSPYGGNDDQEPLPEPAGREGQAPAGDADDQELYRR